MSKRVIVSLIFILMGLSAKADYTITTQKPFYNPQAAAYYNAQQPYNPTYNQQYNQGYYQNPYQAQAQGQYFDPAQAVTQQQYYNPYQYPRPYVGYGNNLPYIVANAADTATSTTSVPQQIAKSVGRAMMYKMIRGY